MSFLKRMADLFRGSPRPPEPLPFVTFSRQGVSVDLPRYFATPAGQKKLEAIQRETDRLFPHGPTHDVNDMALSPEERRTAARQVEARRKRRRMG